MADPKSGSDRIGGTFAVEQQAIEQGMLVSVEGELDLATARAFEDELRRAEESHDLIVVDLHHVTFLDSTGLHTLIAADRRARERGGRLVLVQGTPQVRRLLELTGTSEQLEIVEDLADAPLRAAPDSSC